MCNPYSLSKGQDAIRHLAKAMRDTTGNLPALPAVFPVNYCIRDGDVYFRTAPGTKLDAASTALNVPGSGWSWSRMGS